MKSDADKKKENLFSQEIAKKVKRKVKGLRQDKGSVWFGLGMMGMVGWSVVVPALMGAMCGIWLDKKHPQTFSWTLSLLIAGLIGGSAIAWFWVEKEDKEMHQHNEDDE